MSRSNLGLGGFAIWFLLVAAGCASQSHEDLDAGLRLFRENKIQEALPLLERAAARDQDNARTLAWLAETHLRLGNTEKAMQLADKSLQLQPRNSFAHLILADALFPYGGNQAEYDTVWYHVEQAVACDSTDGNGWEMMWAKEVFAGDPVAFRRVLRKLVETGFLTRTALAYGRWELRSLPERAVFITNGDMDTFPAEAVQVTEGLRPDVAVVERGLLDTPTGRRFVRDHLDVQLPYDESVLDSLATGREDSVLTAADHILRGWTEQRAEGVFTRPIAFATTVAESYFKDYQDHLVYAGPFLLWQPGPVAAGVDTATIRTSLNAIRPRDFGGPWVGERDRSPIRRVYTKHLAKNITWSAIAYAQELIGAGRTREAADVLTWADTFERATELGPALTGEIERLRGELDRSGSHR